MRAPILASLFVLVLASTAAQAGGIYQWKDAKGVTHYTDTPPPDSQYKQRNIYHPESDAPPATDKAATENPSCITARQNISKLQNSKTVQMDTDGDGKPDKTLDDKDRANQLALAQAMVNASCTGGG
ncbi:DUF4124 domain-containing protein [Pseudoluteimonas lycopersici]|uniref:DUF4124 domain-containing protein n=1 Tax=Pseudoluteimonas lycopersici TaxID=1324796 RepID=A0A516V7E5_9GAMM|nr:DUF4124 domain-containing protein [Lysobacter lycopersici]QDQ74448.1 DUF4124 domain-containing protein [Lysobacter lycopersici]